MGLKPLLSEAVGHSHGWLSWCFHRTSPGSDGLPLPLKPMSTAGRDARSGSLPHTCDALGPAHGCRQDHQRPGRWRSSVLPLGPVVSLYECCGDTGPSGRDDPVPYKPGFPFYRGNSGTLYPGVGSQPYQLARPTSKEAYVLNLDASFTNLQARLLGEWLTSFSHFHFQFRIVYASFCYTRPELIIIDKIR